MIPIGAKAAPHVGHRPSVQKLECPDDALGGRCNYIIVSAVGNLNQRQNTAMVIRDEAVLWSRLWLRRSKPVPRSRVRRGQANDRILRTEVRPCASPQGGSAKRCDFLRLINAQALSAFA